MRADIFLAEQGLAPSRETAKKLILGGCVRICGSTVKKPSCDIGDGVPASDVEILPSEDTRYVSRGGLKLEAALDSFSIDVSGMRAIDTGAAARRRDIFESRQAAV